MRPLAFFFAAIADRHLSGRAKTFLALVFALHLGFSLFFVFAIPLHGGPDESKHFAYVRQLVEERALPVLTDPHETTDSRTGAIAQHPPLTYVVAAPLYALTRDLGDQNCERVLRLTSVIWGVLTLLFTWRILRENFPDQLALCFAALAFAALLPHFLLLSSVLNNDGPLICFSAAFLWRWLRLCREAGTARDWAILGVIWGLALLSKATALLYIAPVALVLLLQIARKKRSFPYGARALGAFIVPGLLLGGWWFARFYFMIGRIQPIPEFPEYRPLLLASPWELLYNPDAPILVGRFVAGAMRSIWGQVDWSFAPTQLQAMNTGYEFWPSLWGATPPAPAPSEALLLPAAQFGLTLGIYRAAVALTGVAALGLILRLAKRDFAAPLRLLALWFGMLYAALAAYTLFKHPGFFEGGRYLLPALPATAALWVWGIGAWIPPRAQKWLAPVLMGFFVLWNLACALNLTQFLVPFYAPRA